MAWTRTRLEVPAITGDPSVLLAAPPPDGGWTPRLDRTVTVSALIMRAAGPSRSCQAFFRSIHDFFQTPRRSGRKTARASTKQAPLCAGVKVSTGPRFSTPVRTVLSLATHLRAGRCAPSRNVLQWQPLPAVPPATLHSTLLTTESGAAIPCRTWQSGNGFSRQR